MTRARILELLEEEILRHQGMALIAAKGLAEDHLEVAHALMLAGRAVRGSRFDLEDRKDRSIMRTYAIVNRKGGVGKTTTAVNLAYVLATSCRLRVLLVDADGQGGPCSGEKPFVTTRWWSTRMWSYWTCSQRRRTCGPWIWRRTRAICDTAG